MIGEAQSADRIGVDGPASLLWAAAAVRERFVPDTLLDAWRERGGAADLREAVQVLLDMETIGMPIDEGANDGAGGSDEELPCFQLNDEDRREVLARSDEEVIRRAAEEIAAPTAVEAMFRRLLRGEEAVDPANSPREDLVAYLRASDWVFATGRSLPVSRALIEQHLRRIDFIETLGGRDLSRFVGRKRERQALAERWKQVARGLGPTLIEGPGGIGKSLLVTRFVADILDDPVERPDAVFHIDFDRPLMQRARVSTILAEMLAQSRFWGERDAPVSEGPARVLDSSFVSLEAVGQSLRGYDGVDENLSRARRLLAICSSRVDPHILLFVDTFEQVESFDETAARSVDGAAELLRQAGAKVMVVYASRSFAKTNEFLGGRPQHIALGRLSQREGADLLRAEAAKRHVTLDPALAGRAQSLLRGSPLALRLGIELIGPADEFDPEAWLERLGTDRRRMQAMLYQRFLDRIRSPIVQKLAKPGLLLRRLTPEVIAKVLARPCGLAPGLEAANGAYTSALLEGQLFVPDPADPGALWHRRDVREQMLEDLRAEIEPDVARAIHDGAVAYYADRDDPIHRAEELYHRLVRGDPLAEIDARWTNAAGERLRNSLDELPAAGGSFVRRRLGGAVLQPAAAPPVMSAPAPASSAGGFDMLGGAIDMRSSIATQAPEATALQDELELARLSELRLLARKRLQSGDDRIEDVFAALGIEPGLATPLGDLWAEVMMRRGSVTHFIASAKELRLAKPNLPGTVRSGIYAVAAAAMEGVNDVGDANRFWREAYELNDGEAEPMAGLSCMIGMIRTTRKLRKVSSVRRLTGSLAQWMRSMGVRPLAIWPDKDRRIALGVAARNREAILARRVLPREVAAELFDFLLSDFPGNQSMSDDILALRTIVTSVMERGDAFPSVEDDPERAGAIAAAVVPDSRPPRDARELSYLMLSLLHHSPPGFPERLMTLLRDEVDWTIARATTARATTWQHAQTGSPHFEP